MKKKPPAAKIEQPTPAKHETVRFSLGTLSKAKDGRVIQPGNSGARRSDG